MPSRNRRNNRRKSKYVTKRGLPFQLMKYAETKYHDVIFTDQMIVSPPDGTSIKDLTSIANGTSTITRIGSDIQISGVYITFTCTGPDSPGNVAFFRAILYSDRDIGTVSAAATNVREPVDPEQFKVWDDKLIVCPTNTGSPGPNGVIRLKKKFKPYMKAIYNSAIGGSITQGNLKVTLLGSETLLATVSMHARVFFKDL